MKSKSKINIQKYSLILILIAMMVVCSFLSSNFFTTKNLTNILKQVSIVTICAFAQGMIIICGEIDLSIGYLAGMAGSYAITATVIGGTSFSGGAGTAFGTLLGSLIIGVLNNIMNLMGIDSYLQMIIKGAIIIFAVLIDVLSKTQKIKVKIMAPAEGGQK